MILYRQYIAYLRIDYVYTTEDKVYKLYRMTSKLNLYVSRDGKEKGRLEDKLHDIGNLVGELLRLLKDS